MSNRDRTEFAFREGSVTWGLILRVALWSAVCLIVTVVSTVGFGDITPQTAPARLLVAGPMLLDLVIIGAVVQVIFNAARNRLAPGGSSDPG